MAAGFLSHHRHQQPLAAIGPHHDDHGSHTGDGCVQYGETGWVENVANVVCLPATGGCVHDQQAAADKVLACVVFIAARNAINCGFGFMKSNTAALPAKIITEDN